MAPPTHRLRRHPPPASAYDKDSASADKLLERAIADCDEQAAIAVMRSGDPNTVYMRKARVLHSAIEKGMRDLAARLLLAGACVFQLATGPANRLTTCCLCAVVRKGDVRMMRLMFAVEQVVETFNHNFDFKCTHDYACYSLAAREGKLEMVEVLLGSGPSCPTHVQGSMLTYALRRGQTDVVRLLLRSGNRRPTFDDVETALREECHGVLIDLVRAGGVGMRAHDGPANYILRANTIVRVAEAVVAGSCSAEVLRRLLKCTILDWSSCYMRAIITRDSNITAAVDVRCWAVVGALLAYGWSEFPILPDLRELGAAAHTAGGATDALYDDDYASVTYEDEGKHTESSVESGGGGGGGGGGSDDKGKPAAAAGARKRSRRA